MSYVDNVSDKELGKYLKRMVSQEDLSMASRVLPADHPIRPALKVALAKRKKKKK